MGNPALERSSEEQAPVTHVAKFNLKVAAVPVYLLNIEHLLPYCSELVV